LPPRRPASQPPTSDPIRWTPATRGHIGYMWRQHVHDNAACVALHRKASLPLHRAVFAAFALTLWVTSDVSCIHHSSIRQNSGPFAPIRTATWCLLRHGSVAHLVHPTLTSSCSFLFKTSVPLISRKKDLNDNDLDVTVWIR